MQVKAIIISLAYQDSQRYGEVDTKGTPCGYMN